MVDASILLQPIKMLTDSHFTPVQPTTQYALEFVKTYCKMNLIPLSYITYSARLLHGLWRLVADIRQFMIKISCLKEDIVPK